MAVKKSALYSTLWEACNKLRGGVEPARYKDYVLVLLFHKYVSDRYKGKKFGEFKVSDEISFDALVRLKGSPNIGEEATKVIQAFLEVNNLAGEIPVNFNNSDELGTGQELVDKVTGLIAVFENPALDFRSNTSAGDDIIGDAYEYFMMKFAQESGKSKGQFYTPAEVSRVIARLIGIDSISYQEGKHWTLYDPTCGSGSLLVRADDEAPEKLVSIYGQEKDRSTAALAKINLILHGRATAEIKKGSTMTNPQFLDSSGQLQTFDFVVMNPPFSDKSWSDGLKPDSDIYHRFDTFGVPPEKNGDYAWFLHVIKSLNSTGKAGIVMPHGVLFRGNAEEEIRRKILETRYIRGIISLPANLFYGTGIPACIILLDKENAYSRTGIFFIDAGEGFRKDGSMNRLREQDIERIVRVFKAGEQIEGYSRFVPYSEILGDNGGNLNVPRYVQRAGGEEAQDIAGHITGLIPKRDIDALSGLWRVSPELMGKIFAEKGGMFRLSVRPEEVSGLILNDERISAQRERESRELFVVWREGARELLGDIEGADLKGVIRELGERLLELYGDSVFADKYGVFDCLMNYWNEAMQDDLYMVQREGWIYGRKVEYEYTKAKDGGKGKVKSFDGALIPRVVVEGECFAEVEDDIEAYADMVVNADLEIEEILEEHSDEEGNIDDEGRELLRVKTVEREGFLREAKRLHKKLDVLVLGKYEELTEEEIRGMLFEGKWMGRLSEGIAGEAERGLVWYVSRVEGVVRRYERTLGEIEGEVESSRRGVVEALGRMGYEW